MNYSRVSAKWWCLSAALLLGLWMSRTTTTAPRAREAALESQLNKALAANKFSGQYADPMHPNCKRIILVHEPDALVAGTDGDPGCPPDGSGESWEVSGTVDMNSIVVDFSPKGGPKELHGMKVVEGIRWEDGNIWTSIPTTRE